MKALITVPNYDDATAYLYCYAEELIKFAEEKNIFIIQLRRPRLRRRILEESINKQNPQLLLFNAHGDETTIYGDKIGRETEYLVREEENHQLLRGRLTYARACSAAASLGRKCTQESGCFIGYNKKNILNLLGKQDEPGAMASAMLLWNNMMVQEVLGNEGMKLSN